MQLGSYGRNANGITVTCSANGALQITDGITYNIGDGGVWKPAVGGSSILSSWVSRSAGKHSDGGNVEPNGIYAFTTTFSLSNPDYAGFIYLRADDTTAVYLNGFLVRQFAGGGNSTCQDALPNCTVSLLVDLLYGDFLSGTNTLTFDVDQTNPDAEGLDFSGSISLVPERGSLVLLGTGLRGAVGETFRRM